MVGDGGGRGGWWETAGGGGFSSSCHPGEKGKPPDRAESNHAFLIFN